MIDINNFMAKLIKEIIINLINQKIKIRNYLLLPNLKK